MDQTNGPPSRHRGLVKVADFRNLLVHGYADVDDSKMFSIMRNDLGDIEKWLRELKILMEGKTSQGDAND